MADFAGDTAPKLLFDVLEELLPDGSEQSEEGHFGMSYYHEPDGQMALLELSCPEYAATPPRRKAQAKSVSELVAIPYLYLDLSPGHVDLFGNHYWELRSPYREGKLFLNTGPAPREPIHRSLSDILEPILARDITCPGEPAGDPATGEGAWQRAAAPVEGGADGTGGISQTG